MQRGDFENEQVASVLIAAAEQSACTRRMLFCCRDVPSTGAILRDCGARQIVTSVSKRFCAAALSKMCARPERRITAASPTLCGQNKLRSPSRQEAHSSACVCVCAPFVQVEEWSWPTMVLSCCSSLTRRGSLASCATALWPSEMSSSRRTRPSSLLSPTTSECSSSTRTGMQPRYRTCGVLTGATPRSDCFCCHKSGVTQHLSFQRMVGCFFFFFFFTKMFKSDEWKQ